MRLVHLAISPWSLRARWTLREVGLGLGDAPGAEGGEAELRLVEYTPGVDEAWLRWVLGEFRPWVTVSVPVLVLDKDGVKPLRGSGEMVRHFIARGASKLELGDAATLEKVEAIAETLMSGARHRAAERLLRAEGDWFDDELLPAPLRYAPSKFKAYLIRRAYRNLQSKYARPGWSLAQGDANALQDMRAGLEELRSLLQARPDPAASPYLCGSKLTYVDIVAACALAMAPPPPDVAAKLRESPLTRFFYEPDLPAEFADVVAWRNGVMATHGFFEREFARPHASSL